MDSLQWTTEKMRSDLADCELQFIQTADSLNRQLACCETLCEKHAAENLQMESHLQRTNDIMESYLDAQAARGEPGGQPVPVLKFAKIDETTSSLRSIIENVLTFKEVSEEQDDLLRERSRNHIAEIERLQEVVRELERRLVVETKRADNNTIKCERAEHDVKFCANKMLKTSLQSSVKSTESWAAAMRWAGKAQDLERRIETVRPALLGAFQHSHPVVSQLGQCLVDVLGVCTMEEMQTMRECMAMGLEGQRSWRIRKYGEEPPKVKGGKGGKGKPGAGKAAPPRPKSGGKGGGKAPAAAKKGGKKGLEEASTATSANNTQPGTPIAKLAGGLTIETNPSTPSKPGTPNPGTPKPGTPKAGSKPGTPVPKGRKK